MEASVEQYIGQCKMMPDEEHFVSQVSVELLAQINTAIYHCTFTET